METLTVEGLEIRQEDAPPPPRWRLSEPEPNRRDFLTALLTSAVVIASHVEAANNRLDAWCLAHRPTPTGRRCSVCHRGHMRAERDDGSRLAWFRCDACGMGLEGVQREAA